MRDDYRNAVHELLAPDVFPAEAAHALTRAERRKIVPVGDAAKLPGDLMTTAPQLYPYRPMLPRALDISSQRRVGLYDCLYVALAEGEGCELVSADDKLVKNLQPHFSFGMPLSALP